MFNVIKMFGSYLFKDFRKPFCLYKQSSYFSTLISTQVKPTIPNICTSKITSQNSLLKAFLQADNSNLCQSRNVTKFSLKTGKKKSVSSVLTRFFRLNNGLWIRRRAGCHKRIWKRNCFTKYGFAQHVVCTKAQCMMFDKMITDHHKKIKYYIDDPFEPYHVRNNFHWVLPRKVK